MSTDVGAAPPCHAPRVLLGDCRLVFAECVEYEPPLYLFPELLPPVPVVASPESADGTSAVPSVTACDAVQTCLDPDSSRWNVLNFAAHFRAEAEGSVKEEGATDPSRESLRSEVEGEAEGQQIPRSSMQLLFSLIATGRLSRAGLAPTVLQHGGFSSAAVLGELNKLKINAKLQESEAKAIMTNHFLNLIAWRALRSINSDSGTFAEDDVATFRTKRQRDAESGAETTNSETAPWKRSRADPPTSEVGLQPSTDPWQSEYTLKGVFVAEDEPEAHERIELLHVLRKLYQQPWRTLHSLGVQTDLRTAGLNTTLPFADPLKLPGSIIDLHSMITQSPTGDTSTSMQQLVRAFFASDADPSRSAAAQAKTLESAEEDTTAWRIRVLSTMPHASHKSYEFALTLRETEAFRLKSDTHGTGSSGPAVGALVPFSRAVHFGRAAGVVDESGGLSETSATKPGATADGHASSEAGLAQATSCSAYIHVGIGELSQNPESLSQHHFSLLLRLRDAQPTSPGAPTSELILLNYGRNGVVVENKKWVLGSPYQLQSGDVLLPTSDIRIEVSKLCVTETSSSGASSDRDRPSESQLVKTEACTKEDAGSEPATTAPVTGDVPQE